MKTHIVSEVVDGRVVETPLPEQEAKTLHDKLKKAGADTKLYKRCTEQVEKQDLPKAEA